MEMLYVPVAILLAETFSERIPEGGGEGLKYGSAKCQSLLIIQLRRNLMFPSYHQEFE